MRKKKIVFLPVQTEFIPQRVEQGQRVGRVDDCLDGAALPGHPVVVGEAEPAAGEGQRGRAVHVLVRPGRDVGVGQLPEGGLAAAGPGKRPGWGWRRCDRGLVVALAA